MNEIVEDAKTFGVFAVLNVDEGADLSRLDPQFVTWLWATPIRMTTYLERDMVIPYPDFQLLLSDDVLFRPVLIVFPVLHFSLLRHPWKDYDTYLVISLLSTILLSSFTTKGPIHTARVNTRSENEYIQQIG